ncbi:hypothetical protein CRE_08416 [Caenorhabditis remanei]|uniref:Phlebovirus glycoprotein G2 fusion domain-containing protein n=1 Tax=Caenorhabditis remanei TaxID=31234 RepID=E3MPM0_CAERE|nr:hypothetical protein CRE_08416 [Caenorhabditis remanei]
MGSCQGDKCANVTRNSLLPELQVVNHFVGNTGCSESCGGPGCGCFYVSSGCLFYRTYAFPLSPEPLEIFSCMDYQPVAKLLLTVTTHNSWKNKAETLEMLTPIGRTTSFMDIAVTVETIETPPAPALNS